MKISEVPNLQEKMDELSNIKEGLNLWRHFFNEGYTKKFVDTISNFGVEENEMKEELIHAIEEVQNINSTMVKSNWIQEMQADFTQIMFGPHKLKSYPFESIEVTGEKQLLQPLTIDIRKEYLQAGVALKNMNCIPDDFISIELEFVFILLDRAITKYKKGDSEGAIVDITTFNNFMKNHILKWVPNFLGNASSSSYQTYNSSVFKIAKYWFEEVGEFVNEIEISA